MNKTIAPLAKVSKNPLLSQVFKQCPRMTSTQSYTERQAKLGRPISPHVEIYAFPITALSSIVVRVTGGALGVGLGGIAAMGLVGADVPALLDSFKASSPALVPLAKFCVAFPLSYHYLGGIRHVYWDNLPENLVNEKVEKTSYGLIAGAGIISAGLAAYTIQ